MTSKRKPALLALEDGEVFKGWSFGAPGETFGELVFNTGMTGYQEVLTDPSYQGQIVVMTYPEIGIYGVNPEDVESDRVQVAGYVVQRAVRAPFNHRATRSFTNYLAQASIVAIEGVDTRALTRHLRTHGAQRGAIAAGAVDARALVARVRRSATMAGSDLAGSVTPEAILVAPVQQGAQEGAHIVIVDAGCKDGIVRHLTALGARVTRVPYDVEVEAVLKLAPDGVLISNGPGDPEPLAATIDLTRALLHRRVPLAGICLGHQLLGLAAGGKTYKMRFGHRGANHPVKDMISGRVIITTQNHGFAVDPTSLGIGWTPLDAAFTPSHPELCERVPTGRDKPTMTTMAEQLPPEPPVGESPAHFGPIEVTHLSLNDGTLEGMRLRDYPAFSVQFHPEASPGPHDARAFFTQFMTMVEERYA